MIFTVQQFDELDRLLTHSDAIANLMRAPDAAEDQEAVTGAASALAHMLERARQILDEAQNTAGNDIASETPLT